MKSSVILHLAAAGVAACILATVTHEVLGHGGTCLALGGRITLLSSVFFRSQPHRFIVDVGGPLANLLAGLALWGYLRRAGGGRGSLGLVLWWTLAFNWCWLAGYLVKEAFTHTGDLALAWPSPAAEGAWRLLAGALGVAAYAFGLRRMLRPTWPGTLLADYQAALPPLVLVAVPYAAGGLAAGLAALCYAPAPAAALVDASLEIWGASAPLLLLVRRGPRGAAAVRPAPLAQPVPRLFYVLVGVGFLGFCLVLGRGLSAPH